MSTQETALAALDAELKELTRKLAHFHRKAERVAGRRGERDIHADRLCEWVGGRVERLAAARERIAKLIETDTEYDTALAALKEHYRRVAHDGYAEAGIWNSREIHDRFVVAAIRRQTALEGVAEGAPPKPNGEATPC